MIGPMFILMVLNQPGSMGTWVMTFQEFNTQDRCEFAKSMLLKERLVRTAACVPK